VGCLHFSHYIKALFRGVVFPLKRLPARTNRTLAVRLLEKRGYDVSIAMNGREAVQAAEREEFGVVLMDMQMPEMDGFEATAAIREKERGTSRHTPIVAMTAHALKADEDRCPDSGMDGYISKPIRSSQLCEILERMLDAHEAKGSAAVAVPGEGASLT
jgi:two-component system sensor histidine kinase/response regulator